MFNSDRNLVCSACPGASELNTRIGNRLDTRVSSDDSYTLEEIQRVSSLDRRLFPPAFELDKESSEQIRALCALSKTALQPEIKITSHRKFVGVFIVILKRILWRFITPVLEKTFDGIQEYNSWLIYSHAAHLQRLQTLESELSELKSEA